LIRPVDSLPVGAFDVHRRADDAARFQDCLLLCGYQQMGRSEEAKAAMRKRKELRPGSTYHNVPTPTKNSSPIYIEAAERIMQLMIAAGLPAS
jgi:hypothetical protein